MANVKGTTEVVKNAAAKKMEEAKDVVKTVAKAAQAKAEEVKAEAEAKEAAKSEEKAAKAAIEAEKKDEKKEEQKEEPKEEAPAKAPKAERKTRKSAAKTAKAAKKTAAEPKIYVQFGAGESSVDAIVEKIKAEYVEQGHRVSSIKDLRVYLKPEDGAAYYVINEKVAGRVDLF